MDLLKKIPISEIVESPFQGRFIIQENTGNQEDTSLNELMSSISKNGLMQPIVVRMVDERYELIDGQRRVEASKRLGLKEIQALVKTISDRDAMILSVVGNLQREDLSPIEKAMAFRKVLESGVFADKKELSVALGKDETYVGDVLNTLNMDQRIIDDLLRNRSINDVRLLRIIRRVEKTDENNKSDKQWEIYKVVVEKALSRSEVMELVMQEKKKPLKSYSVVKSAHKIHIQFNERYSKKQREKIRNMLEEKLEEIIREAVGGKDKNEFENESI